MKGMVVRIKVSGFENENVEKLTLKEEKSGLLSVSTYLFNKVVDGERENVLMRLMGRFKSLRYEDLEEVYNDGCLVLWGKMMDKEFKLKEKSMVGYLVRVCRNIGMHYLRKVNEDIESLDRIMKRGYEVREDDERGIEEIFDVMDERGNEDERYEKLDRIWSKLKEVDRMILESYYVDGCKMEEIAKRIGYKNGNSVKSKKKKVLMKIMEMKERADFKDLPAAA
jgi:RNA polymerase sigma factor (sigma-70 family)